jgi:ATP-dependent Clp protease adaptor protein ClpS
MPQAATVMSIGTKPLGKEEESTLVIEPWNVILLNDDWHTFEDVIIQLVRATGCSVERAEAIAWEAHSKGEALCYTGPKERAELVASILEEIDLAVRLEAA